MAINITVPDLGESVVEATVALWLKKEGEAVKAGEAVVELETDKVNLEVSADTDGILARIERDVGSDVTVGEVLGVLDESGASNGSAPAPTATEPEKAAEPIRTASTPSSDEDNQQATPVAKRLAAAEQVDLAEVEGTGSRGKVTKDDVQRFIEGNGDKQPSQPAAPAVPHPGTAALPEALAAAGAMNRNREERVKMSRRRRTIAKRLLEAQQTAAILTTFNEMDMSAVNEFRARHKEGFQEKHGIKLGLSSFFVKACVGALKKFPTINAEIQGDEIVLKHYYDIGVAIGAEDGLVVPVLRDADRMTFAEIEEAVRDYAVQAKEGTLQLKDLQGGTFTITNGGVFGSLMSTPILNPPQVGILGLHAMKDRPVVVDGEIVIRPMMYIALSYDHRIVDGREAVQFLVAFKEYIEDMEKLMLEA